MALIPSKLTGRQKVLTGVAVILFAVGGFLIYNAFQEEPPPPPPPVPEGAAPPPVEEKPPTPPSLGPARRGPGGQ